MSMEENRMIDYEDYIEDDGAGYRVLPNGEYTFTVQNVERGFYLKKEGGKMPDCKMLTVSLLIADPEGDVLLRDNFYLFADNMWKAAAFFRAVGMKKPGERVRMDWNAAMGKWGRVRLTESSYEKNGTRYPKNDIAYLDYDPMKMVTLVTPEEADVPW